MELIKVEDCWTEFQKNILAACPGVSPIVLEPLLRELEATIERRIAQAIDETKAQIKDKEIARKRKSSIDYFRTYASVRCDSEYMSDPAAKRQKLFCEEVDKLIGIDNAGPIQLESPKKQWKDAEFDPEIGETMTSIPLANYQHRLVMKGPGFRPKRIRLEDILEEYKKVQPNPSTEEFLKIYKLYPEKDESFYKLVKKLRAFDIYSVIELATECSESMSFLKEILEIKPVL